MKSQVDLGALSLKSKISYSRVVLIIAFLAPVLMMSFSVGRVQGPSLNKFGFVNKIVSGNPCNGLGADQYVQNTDAKSAYNVTIKIVFYKPGDGSSESQKVYPVPAGGKVYLGCSAGHDAGVTYTYTVVGESK